MTMTKRELMLSAINREESGIPSWTMAFFNIGTARRLLGTENVMTDYEATGEYKTGRADDTNRALNVRYAEAVDNCAIAVGRGGNFAFGHGGPGEFMERIVERGDDYLISEYETGVKRLMKWDPHFYHNYDHPLKTLEGVAEYALPDADDPARYEGVEGDAAYYRSRGYMPYANLNGIFSGLHYFLYPYDLLFEAMLLDKESLKTLIIKLAAFNLTAAENLLKRGAEMITTCDDLCDGRSLLFSPELYREYFAAYHAELAALCHSYGAYLHLHSHGNINKLLPSLIEAGIDIINPFDPFEIGPLNEIKERFGDKIIITGGMDKFFFEFNRAAMYEFLKFTIETGGKGGGFILMDSGGIPETVFNETYDYYRDISRELRYARRAR